MTPPDLSAIAQRAQQATEGPWEAQNRHSDFGPCFNTIHAPAARRWLTDNDGIDRYEDAVFMAHARTDIPALLAEVERLQTENKDLHDTLDNLVQRGL